MVFLWSKKNVRKTQRSTQTIFFVRNITKMYIIRMMNTVFSLKDERHERNQNLSLLTRFCRLLGFRTTAEPCLSTPHNIILSPMTCRPIVSACSYCLLRHRLRSTSYHTAFFSCPASSGGGVCRLRLLCLSKLIRIQRELPSFPQQQHTTKRTNVFFTRPHHIQHLILQVTNYTECALFITVA